MTPPPPRLPSWLPGVFLATAFAGPVGAIGVFAALAWMESTGVWREMPGILVLLPPAMLFGSVIAFVPILIGADTLARAGRRHRTFRRPSVWAATGGVSGALLPVVVFDGWDSWLGALAVAALGAACALICRWRTRWFD